MNLRYAVDAGFLTAKHLRERWPQDDDDGLKRRVCMALGWAYSLQHDRWERGPSQILNSLSLGGVVALVVAFEADETQPESQEKAS